MNFRGAKIILFLGDDLLILRRDHTEGIPWPGYLDFPGGAREPGETGMECALRETIEEVGLDLGPEALSWELFYDGLWYFAAHLPASRVDDVVWGGEGEGWMMMSPEEFIAREDAIPHFRSVLRDYMDARDAR
ncbi:NUDIX domain-containing protein [Alloyangia pacifica]|uniref:8-oxo-dGTP diphosphatase n=1 Tax=Alloyangia pacifica TaxID=311180 RepID=A0A1I6VAE3_9RHOB|nr:NUDIX hydrolase [Alloyangia pacifica]SDH86560.1 8-oxo-dGTP diphosphatase [Alloyangia pacifica]SFT10706.1 8-oxo-dGTP diphosphatase [Alloyangia pacifica]